MKKNKTIAFMMAAALLVGGTFAGTKAYFTDKTEAYNDLVITMGNLNVDTKESEWKIVSSGSEAGNTTASNRFTNVKPGDKFKKEITITNNGSLKQKIQAKEGQNKEIPSALLVGQNLNSDYSTGRGINGVVLNPGQSITTYIDVEVVLDKNKNESFGGEGNNQLSKVTFNLNDLIGAYSIEAEQTDEPATNEGNNIHLK